MATCTSINTMCDPCRIAYTRVGTTGPPPTLLDCPAGTYPVIFHCIVEGTDEEAKDFIRNQQARFKRTWSRPLPIHAAIRRAVEGDQPPKPWMDVAALTYRTAHYANGPPLPAAYNNNNNNNYKGHHHQQGRKSSLGVFFQKATGLLDSDYEARPRPREVTMLVDFPTEITAGGDMERIFMEGFGNIVVVEVIEHPDSTGHASLHRLRWWGIVHPQIGPEEAGGTVRAATVTSGKGGTVRAATVTSGKGGTVLEV
ncbi:hypothetical protein BJX76DRAFT_37492 [Aspergillus varians]